MAAQVDLWIGRVIPPFFREVRAIPIDCAEKKCMMPEINDTVLFGFTEGQMKFCRNNERQMWQYLIEHDLLFSTDQFTIRKLTGEAPFTTYFTNESPGRAAIWLGFRIIESYITRNKGISLATMMDNTDIQGLLEAAKYDPK